MPRYWFRQKTFGYGSTPNTWQGWLLTLGGVALLIGATFAVQTYVANAQDRVVAQTAAVLLIAGPFCWLCYRKTEGGWRWRWPD